MHDDCKNVNSNAEVTKLIKGIYNQNIFFHLQEKKKHDHSKEIERESHKMFGTSLICKLDFALIKMLKISALNYPSCLLVNLLTQIAVCKLNYLIFLFV